jgi:hypothetical protein
MLPPLLHALFWTTWLLGALLAISWVADVMRLTRSGARSASSTLSARTVWLLRLLAAALAGCLVALVQN